MRFCPAILFRTLCLVVPAVASTPKFSVRTVTIAKAPAGEIAVSTPNYACPPTNTTVEGSHGPFTFAGTERNPIDLDTGRLVQEIGESEAVGGSLAFYPQVELGKRFDLRIHDSNDKFHTSEVMWTNGERFLPEVQILVTAFHKGLLTYLTSVVVLLGVPIGLPVVAFYTVLALGNLLVVVADGDSKRTKRYRHMITFEGPDRLRNVNTLPPPAFPFSLILLSPSSTRYCKNALLHPPRYPRPPQRPPRPRPPQYNLVSPTLSLSSPSGPLPLSDALYHCPAPLFSLAGVAPFELAAVAYAPPGRGRNQKKKGGLPVGGDEVLQDGSAVLSEEKVRWMPAVEMGQRFRVRVKDGEGRVEYSDVLWLEQGKWGSGCQCALSVLPTAQWTAY
ncbi:hypothetical protein JCM8547_007599 [Rhodosporidiobolus lusitaniae]